MNVAVVHYHARPGGVTRVVERAVDALGDRAECLFFTGAAGGESKGPLWGRIRTVHDLDYSKEKDAALPDLEKQARQEFGAEPDLWHVHNHSLGKNPALTRELLRFARDGKKVLFQIHDFAEDGRSGNYRNLGTLAERLYPTAPNIHYAVLNRRDFNFLLDAGVPEETLHLLPNPVPAFSCSSSRMKESGGSPLYVYPCRAIRRKNIGELLLWSAKMPQARFAVTLAPANPEVKPIYEAWVAFSREAELQVEFDAGARTPFEELISRADALITTSIAEGFGLAFLEPWMADKPLTGRNLPEITADFAEHGLDLSALYRDLPVPLVSSSGGACWDIADEFYRELEKSMRAVYQAYGREWKKSLFEKAVAALVKDGRVDFGILNETMQRTLIRAVQKDPDLISETPGDSSGAVQKNRSVTESAYSPEAYGEHLFSIYQELLNSETGTVQYADSEKLLDRFLDGRRFNLLRA